MASIARTDSPGDEVRVIVARQQGAPVVDRVEDVPAALRDL
jgi:hypothetical protein